VVYILTIFTSTTQKGDYAMRTIKITDPKNLEKLGWVRCPMNKDRIYRKVIESDKNSLPVLIVEMKIEENSNRKEENGSFDSGDFGPKEKGRQSD
jgi:hypothetical protein